MLGRKCRYRGLTKKHQDTFHLFITKAAISRSEMLHLQVGTSYSSYSRFLTSAEVPAMGYVLITSLEFFLSVLSFRQ